jgi:hypothetical protein
VDLSTIAGMRLARQGLTAPRFESAEAVVGWLGAVQSQEYDVARWSLGQRSTAETDASLEQALADGRVLRTHVLRPTWHFVLPADIRWLVELTAPRIRRAMAYYDRQLEIDAATVALSNRLIVDALERAGSLTRTELAKVLAVGGIEASGQRLGHLMFHAELGCLVCSGPRKGKQHTYALFERRAPGAQSLPADEALAELTRRFFTGHGPATPKDLAVWASLTLTEARRGLAMLGGEVDSFEVEGRTYWMVGGTPPPPENAPRALLLQGYDEYIMGYNETKDVFGAGGRSWMAPGRPPMTHALMIDGQIVGHWRRHQSPSVVTVDLQLYRTLDAWEREAVEAEVVRYGAFVGLPASVGSVEAPAG